MFGSKATVTTFGFGNYSSSNLAMVFGFGNGKIAWTPGFSPASPRRRSDFVLGQNRQTDARLTSLHKQKPSLTLLRTTPPELGE